MVSFKRREWGQVSCIGTVRLMFRVLGVVISTFSNHSHLKDDAYYCYCAYVLRIFRYSDFLSPMLTNAGIFLRGLKLSRESRS